ncbi:MAG: SIMPL domain-containing protein [Candidatus Andersenbacteria bacterium]|nr:SIMPL domain-containing protein [Candidatus Andersenbacteria bacterium]MBI3251233.1 SIMPL domain-containing protein [Candidatus Andersenbacteria bacterium]
MNNVISAVIVAGLFYLAGQYVVSSPNREQQALEADREITVAGESTISTRPDIAKITVGTQTEPRSTAQAALEDLTTKFDQVVDALEKVGIEEKDIRTTNFSLNPQYDFTPDGRQTLRGYTASENVIVTVRDLEKIGDVISQTTAAGANQVGGVSFEIDEDSDIKAQAEEEAIQDAREKAERLADALGTSLGSVKRYQASSGGGYPVPLYDTLQAEGRGGDAALKVPVGENETTVNVSVTFELR